MEVVIRNVQVPTVHDSTDHFNRTYQVLYQYDVGAAKPHHLQIR